MAFEKKLLGGTGEKVSVSPQSLYAQGIIKTKPYPGGLSYVMRMKLAAEKRQSGVGNKTKRERRQERRDKMIAARDST
jgi:hypothetical protein